VLGLAIRSPGVRSHGKRDVRAGFTVRLAGFSAAFTIAVVGVRGPRTVPVKSCLRVYPKIESPSMEFWRVKLGIDFTGLGDRDV